jgi:hypothetical protein
VIAVKVGIWQTRQIGTLDERGSTKGAAEQGAHWDSNASPDLAPNGVRSIPIVLRSLIGDPDSQANANQALSENLGEIGADRRFSAYA